MNKSLFKLLFIKASREYVLAVTFLYVTVFRVVDDLELFAFPPTSFIKSDT